MNENMISNENEIKLYLHCKQCLDERPKHISPKDWSRNQAGWTTEGIQLWCNRHEANIIHIDFQGKIHPANETRKSERTRNVI